MFNQIIQRWEDRTILNDDTKYRVTTGTHAAQLMQDKYEVFILSLRHAFEIVMLKKG